MKTVLLFSLLIAGTTFGQSKKDLKTQVASYQKKLDSTNLVLEKTQHSNDSLSKEIQRKEIELKDKQATLDYRTKELEILETQIKNMKSSKQEDPAPKLTKIPRNNDNPFSNHDSPFSNNGKGGTGYGSRELGEDNGDGNGRRLIRKPDVSEIASGENCTILFQVVVDENGKIIGTPALVRPGTTTTNQVLIKQVSAVVKSQAKYNPVKGAKNTKMIIPIKIEPN